MGLNRVKNKSNMYQFIDATWNPIKGRCSHDCSYCYMKRWGQLNPIRFDEKELREFDRDIKKYGDKKTIFVGSSCDLFAEDVPELWISEVLRYCNKYDNLYLFQSKNPQRFEKYIHSIVLQRKSVFATTIETNRHYPEIMQNAPKPVDRIKSMKKFIKLMPLYITIEPIMDFDLNRLIAWMEIIQPLQINVGADSQGHNLPEPKSWKVKKLLTELRKITTVKEKKNLRRLQ